MTIPARIVPPFLALALAFSFGAQRAGAQAMISYGHGVAKAAGAGAAVGGGVGGILTGLGNPLATAAGRRGEPGKANATVQRQTVPTRRGAVAWDAPQQGFGAPEPLALVGGIQASGAAETNWQPTLLQPSQNLAVISASWGGPSADEAEESGEAPAETAVTEQAPAEGQVPATAKQGAAVVRSSGHVSVAGGNAPAPRPGTAVPAAIPAGVTVGTSVEDLLKKLGKPYLALRGVAGEGYTDQYVFELPDGGHLVVYVLDGVVAHLAVG